MKTPEEIKKGLGRPVTVHYHNDPEPRLTPRAKVALEQLHDAALDYIQRLERERDAAVKILTDIAHYEDWFGGVDICAVCKKDKCKECGNVNGGFEWRGAPEQEKDEPIRAD